MAMYPNIETIMLQITQSLGIGGLQTVQKQRFTKMEKRLSDFITKVNEKTNFMMVKKKGK